MPQSSKPAPRRIDTEVEVRYAETDQMGVVHHAVYLVWFELARTRLCALTGRHYAEIEADGYGLVVTRAELRLLKSAHYGNTPKIACWLERLGSRGMRFAYKVTHKGQTLATGSTEHVWVELASKRPCRAPQHIHEPFAALIESA